MCWPLSGGGAGSPSRSGSVCTAPPSVGRASTRLTSWPASTSSSPAARPASPPPTMTTLTARSHFRRGPVSHASRRAPHPDRANFPVPPTPRFADRSYGGRRPPRPPGGLILVAHPVSFGLRGSPAQTSLASWSAEQAGSDDSQLCQRREMRRVVEYVEPALFDPFQRRLVQIRERRHTGCAAPVEVAKQRAAIAQIGAGPRGLVRHQRLPGRRATAPGDVVLLDAERDELLLRYVDAPEVPVLADVTHDVDQLERDAERLGPLWLVGAVDRDACDTDGAGDAPAVAQQVGEAAVAPLLRVLMAAVDEIVERPRRNGIPEPSVRKRDEHRSVARFGLDRVPQSGEPPALLLGRELRIVGDIVDLARERIHRRDRAPLGLREEHDPVG